MGNERNSSEGNDYETAAVVWGLAKAKVVASALEAAGLRPILKYEAIAELYGIAVNGLGEIRILVRRSDLSKAKEIIEQAERQDDG